MRSRSSILTGISFIIVSISAVCQGQSAPNQATHKQVEDWLRSSDPRIVAWGATFAGSNADAAALPALENLAETYKSLPPRRYDVKGSYVPRTPAQTQQFNSMQAVLDALIQLRGAVPSEGIEAILPDFPDQALVLFATLPEPERSRYALTVYASHDRFGPAL